MSGIKGKWRYRVGDYRLITMIYDGRLLILIVNIGHRKMYICIDKESSFGHLSALIQVSGKILRFTGNVDPQLTEHTLVR